MRIKSWLLLLVFTLSGNAAMAIEEPVYEVLLETKYYEVRRYQPYIVAEVDVDDDFKRAGNSAFRVLAGYIFGDNEPGRKMAMTAPVRMGIMAFFRTCRNSTRPSPSPLARAVRT